MSNLLCDLTWAEVLSFVRADSCGNGKTNIVIEVYVNMHFLDEYVQILCSKVMSDGPRYRYLFQDL